MALSSSDLSRLILATATSTSGVVSLRIYISCILFHRYYHHYYHYYHYSPSPTTPTTLLIMQSIRSAPASKPQTTRPTGSSTSQGAIRGAASSTAGPVFF